VLSYVDDIVVANRKKDAYISDLAETFMNMHEARLKLNPEKCIFGITRGKVLGCLVSTKGIEANPDKIRAITQMQLPQSRKDVQKLTGWIASLNQFIAKLAERSLPFFAILRGSTKNRPGNTAAESVRQYEILPWTLANTIKSRARATSHPICLSYTLSSQWSFGHWERNHAKRQNSEAAVPGIFHFKGLNWVQEVLLWDGEDLLRSYHECPEALALLRCTHN
jgi:hypothetical protein